MTLTAANSQSGCTQVNLIFENFSVSVGAGSGVTDTNPFSMSDYIEGDGTNVNGSGQTAVSALFESETVPYTASGNGGALDTLTWTVTFDVVDTTEVISGFYLEADGFNFGGAGTGNIEESVCLNATCTGGAYTTTFTHTGNPNGDTNFGGPTSAEVYVTITASATLPAGATFSLSDFITGFDQEETSPEPSTFVLLGTALAGVGLLRFRKRRP